MMSFLLPKKRVKFQVELTVLRLADVPLLNATIFAKVRLLECGSFEGNTWHRGVYSYQVDFMRRPSLTNPHNGSTSLASPSTASSNASENENPQPFHFPVRIPFDERTGELEQCRCKISLRKEDRTGRAPQRMGYVIVNLSEFAATGSVGVTQSFLLESYTKEVGRQRQDNSRVSVTVRMTHQAQDPLFKVPNACYVPLSTLEEAQLNPADRKAEGGPPPNCSSSSHGLGPLAGGVDKLGEPAMSTSTPGAPVALHLNDSPSPAQQSHQPFPKSSITSEAGSLATSQPSESHNPASTTGPLQSSQSKVAGSASSQRPPAEGHRTSWNAPYPSTYPFGPHHQPQRMAASWDAGAEHVRRMRDERMFSLGSGCGIGAIGPASGSSTLANRVQKTRRDAEGVIEEVLAESSAIMDRMEERRRRSASSALGAGSREDGGEEGSGEDQLRYGSYNRYKARSRGGDTRDRGLALYITRDGKTAAVDDENISSTLQRDGQGLMLVSSAIEDDELLEEEERDLMEMEIEDDDEEPTPGPTATVNHLKKMASGSGSTTRGKTQART